jgi:hypothetical protein
MFDRWERALNHRGRSVLAEYGLSVEVCDLDDMSTGALGGGTTCPRWAGRQRPATRRPPAAVRSPSSGCLRTSWRPTTRTPMSCGASSKRRSPASPASSSRRRGTRAMQELRERAGLAHMKSDEEIAAEDLGSPYLVEINREDWHKVPRRCRHCSGWPRHRAWTRPRHGSPSAMCGGPRCNA